MKADFGHDADILPLRSRIAQDVPGRDARPEPGAPFCGNPRCALHVRPRDRGVVGAGDWIALPDGRIFGRGCFNGAVLCDACGTRRGPVRLRPTRAAR